MEFLTELATSGGGIGAIVSGVSGLLGGWLSKRENRLLTIQANEHEIKMADIDKEMAKFEFDANVKMAELKKDMQITEAQINLDRIESEGEIAKDILAAETHKSVEESAGRALEASWKVQETPTGYPFVDKFRAATRPALTWALFLMNMGIFMVLHAKVGSIVSEDTEMLVQLYVYLVQSFIYLFILVTSWWFMSRGDKSAENIKNTFRK
jgi:hypothetical protein